MVDAWERERGRGRYRERERGRGARELRVVQGISRGAILQIFYNPALFPTATTYRKK